MQFEAIGIFRIHIFLNTSATRTNSHKNIKLIEINMDHICMHIHILNIYIPCALINNADSDSDNVQHGEDSGAPQVWPQDLFLACYCY